MEVLRRGASASVRLALRSQAMRLQSQLLPSLRSRPSTLLQVRALHTNPRRPSTFRLSELRARIGRRWKSSEADAAIETKPDSKLSLSQRLKKMSREYGWAAIYVYLGLSALDFPFCFLAVKWLGTETIGHWEHVIVSNVKSFLPWFSSDPPQGASTDAVNQQAHQRILEEGQTYTVEDHGYKEALRANTGSDASIWTQLALAYAIHKSFIFIRIPLTAAVLPKVVKTLRGWGYNIGRPSTKAISGRSSKSSGKTGVNTKGSGVKPDD